MTEPDSASQAQLISAATIGHGSKRVIAGVIGGMCLFSSRGSSCPFPQLTVIMIPAGALGVD